MSQDRSSTRSGRRYDFPAPLRSESSDRQRRNTRKEDTRKEDTNTRKEDKDTLHDSQNTDYPIDTSSNLVTEPGIEMNNTNAYQGAQELMLGQLMERLLMQQQQNSLALKLPSTDIQVFDGDPLDYYNFIRAFEQQIERLTTNNSSRLYYLVQYTKGDVKELMKSCLAMDPDEGYSEARRLLKKQYGQSYRIATAHVSKITNGPPIKSEDNIALQKLSVALLTCKNVLKDIGYLSRIENIDALSNIIARLPYDMRKRWRTTADTINNEDREIVLQDVVSFVSKEARIASHPVFGNLSTSRSDTKKVPPASHSKKTSFSTQVHDKPHAEGNYSGSRCHCCFNEGHELAKCPKLISKPVEERQKFIQSKGYCFNCLGHGHRSRFCRKPRECQDCPGKHHPLLHLNNYKTQESTNDDKGEDRSRNQITSSFIQNPPVKERISLPIVPVMVKTKGNSKVAAYALIDNGSNGTFCSQHLIDALKIPSKKSKLSLTTLQSKKYEVDCEIVDLDLISMNGEKFAQLKNVYSRPSLPISSEDIPRPEDLEKWQYLKDVVIPVIDARQVDLIIGNDHSNLLEPKEIINGRNGGPFAVRTVLGWTINGPLGQKTNRGITSNFIKADPELSMQFENFCNMEFNDSISEPSVSTSREDKKALKVFKDSIQLEDGHYNVALPWKSEVQLPNSRPMAEHRLDLLKKRFLKNPDLFSKYAGKIEDLVQKNYAEIVPDKEIERNDGKIWFLPHHPVFHPKKPDKLRVVFDCAARYQKVSLNENLLKGPDLTSSLFGVLMRFRKGTYAIMGDIEAMFHQVHVKPQEKDVFRFLWWLNDDITQDPKDYRMKVHLFGAASSPSICNYALQQIARDNQDKFTHDILESVTKNFYVDDFLRSEDTESSAVKMIEDLSRLLLYGGFHITKWTSNSLDVIKAIPEEERASSVKSLDSLQIERALGILWDTKIDSFIFTTSLKNKPMTRRGILSTVSSIFDPLGFTSPLTLIPKMILQDLCRLKLGWDDKIPDSHERAWVEWSEELSLLSEVKIKRCFKPDDFGSIVDTQLHHFSDAAMNAYGAVSYLRLVNTKGNIHCAFLTSKSRVAPLKAISIPRLELSAATVSIRLDKMVTKELDININQSTFWTDSTTVLKYIHNSEKRFHTFVANRLAVIHDGSIPSQWRKIDTKENVADDTSRGLKVKDLSQNGRWFMGPDFLWKPEDEWPDQAQENSMDLQVDDPEVKKEKIAFATVNSEPTFVEELVQRFSSWYKMKKTYAWLLRYREKLLICRSKRANGEKIVFEAQDPPTKLTVKNLRDAEEEILKKIQESSFGEEMKILKGKEDIKICRRSCIYKLDPILVNGLIRVGGRLRRHTDFYDSKHQIILPKKNPATDLIIRHYHEIACHSGREYCLALIRRRFWPINGNSTIRRIINSCLHCRRRNAPVCQQKMADLPKERVIPDLPPFTNIGVDCFGPFTIKKGRTEYKRYGCIFTCMSCRAVHIEIVHTMNTDSFINALRRFISRRGCPSSIRSDNGGNFVSGDKELKNSIKDWNKLQIEEFLLQKEIKWLYNPPAGSHFGGIWERCIRTVRRILGTLLKEQLLDDEGLSTMMCEVEMIINNRPITHVSDDHKDLQPLTPSHLLLLRDGPRLPPGKFVQQDCYVRRRWRHVQYLADIFWKRWTREYLPLLQKRDKWNHDKQNLCVGDVVLMVDENSHRGSWPLARVLKVRPDNNGYVRIVELKTSSVNSVIRPVDKCVLLEGSTE